MTEETEKDSEEIKDIKIFYEKSPLYRSVRPNGVWTGITPQGEVQIMFFTDLHPLPEFVRHEITSDKALGQEIEKVERRGVLRESEINLAISPQIAIELIKLVSQMLEQLRQKGLLLVEDETEKVEESS